ncbi:MAG: flagellar motor switch protein FliG [Treponema sp.]|nr:flagellar motor switch protein FliG [Treponema sp.]
MNLDSYRLNAYNKVKGPPKPPEEESSEAAEPIVPEEKTGQSDGYGSSDSGSSAASSYDSEYVQISSESKVKSVSSQIRHNSKPGTEPLVRAPVFEKINRKLDEVFPTEKKESRPTIASEIKKSVENKNQAPAENKPRQDESLYSTRKNLSKGSDIPTTEDFKIRDEAKRAAKTGAWFHKNTTTKEDVKAATDKLTSGALIKVPVKEPKPGEKESIYRRVAKFMVVIGIDEAAKIMPHLTEEQTEKIIPEIASIRSVPPEEAQAVLAEFESLLTKAREDGGVDTARTILTKAYGSEKAEEVLKKSVKYPSGKPFEYLEDANAERISILLGGESMAVQALVLSQVEPKKAAAVINAMDEKDKSEVVLRLAKMKPVAPSVMEQIDKSLHEKLLTQNTENSQNMDGRNVLAQILRRMDPTAEYQILGNLSEQDPELGADLRKRLFTEEDVVGCDNRFLQNKLHEMTDKDISILIRGKSENFRKKILENVSIHRSNTILEEESIREHVLKADSERITSQFYADLRRAWENGELIVKGRDDGEIYV